MRYTTGVHDDNAAAVIAGATELGANRQALCWATQLVPSC